MALLPGGGSVSAKGPQRKEIPFKALWGAAPGKKIVRMGRTAPGRTGLREGNYTQGPLRAQRGKGREKTLPFPFGAGERLPFSLRPLSMWPRTIGYCVRSGRRAGIYGRTGSCGALGINPCGGEKNAAGKSDGRRCKCSPHAACSKGHRSALPTANQKTDKVRNRAVCRYIKKRRWAARLQISGFPAGLPPNSTIGRLRFRGRRCTIEP